MYAVFGAATASYGRRAAPQARMRIQASASLVLVSSVAFGVWASANGASHAALLAALGVVMATATATSMIMRWGPPSALFPLLAFSVNASLPHSSSDLRVALATSASTAGFAMALGRIDSRSPRAVIEVPSTATAVIARTSVLNGALTVMAAATAMLLGLSHPYWAAVAAITPLGAGAQRRRTRRAVHRVVGTVMGLGIAWLLEPFPPSGTFTLIVLAALQVLAELYIVSHYGVAMAFVTPFVLMLPRAVAPDVFVSGADRLATTFIGAALGIAWIQIVERRYPVE